MVERHLDRNTGRTMKYVSNFKRAIAALVMLAVPTGAVLREGCLT